MRNVFDAFKVDLDTRKLHSFKPKNEYADLLRSAYYISGSDGIRIIVRPRIPFQFASPFWFTPLSSGASDAILRTASKKHELATKFDRSLDAFNSEGPNLRPHRGNALDKQCHMGRC